MAAGWKAQTDPLSYGGTPSAYKTWPNFLLSGGKRSVEQGSHFPHLFVVKLLKKTKSKRM